MFGTKRSVGKNDKKLKKISDITDRIRQVRKK